MERSHAGDELFGPRDEGGVSISVGVSLPWIILLCPLSWVSNGMEVFFFSEKQHYDPPPPSGIRYKYIIMFAQP